MYPKSDHNECLEETNRKAKEDLDRCDDASKVLPEKKQLCEDRAQQNFDAARKSCDEAHNAKMEAWKKLGEGVGCTIKQQLKPSQT